MPVAPDEGTSLGRVDIVAANFSSMVNSTPADTRWLNVKFETPDLTDGLDQLLDQLTSWVDMISLV